MTYEEVVRVCTDRELFTRVVSLVRYSEEDADRIRSAYMATYKKEVNRTCGNCLGDALAELIHFNRKDSEQMKKQIECRYRLRAGMLIRLGFGDNKYYSNANLTDEVAEKYILANPERIDDFQTVPDDMYDKIKGEPAPDTDAVEEPDTATGEAAAKAGEAPEAGPEGGAENTDAPPGSGDGKEEPATDPAKVYQRYNRRR